MTSVEFSVAKDSPLIGMTFKEIKDKYNVGIFSFKPKRDNGIIQAHDNTKIKENYVIVAVGKPPHIHNIFRDATHHYEIDA
jgi:Trk K+ transport system NAD-binding subunit